MIVIVLRVTDCFFGPRAVKQSDHAGQIVVVLDRVTPPLPKSIPGTNSPATSSLLQRTFQAKKWVQGSDMFFIFLQGV